jgi:hypothetical protein
MEVNYLAVATGAVMWTNEAAKLKWARFLIQGGYQLVLFSVFGLLLQFWN